MNMTIEKGNKKGGERRTLEEGREVLKLGGSRRSNWSKNNQLDWAVWFWREETGHRFASVFMGNMYVGQMEFRKGDPKPIVPIFHGKELKPCDDEEGAMEELLKALVRYLERGY